MRGLDDGLDDVEIHDYACGARWGNGQWCELWTTAGTSYWRMFENVKMNHLPIHVLFQRGNYEILGVAGY